MMHIRSGIGKEEQDGAERRKHGSLMRRVVEKLQGKHFPYDVNIHRNGALLTQ
jgi:hypothetical protein